MSNGLKRRDFLKLLGGGVIGTVISPLPWKLLDDSSIWTQNWSWLASPKRGPVNYTYSHCTLCTSGCGNRVRRVGNQPIALMGAATHPLGRHALCPIGLSGHHLPYHTARISQPRLQPFSGDCRTGAEISSSEAIATLTSWITEARQTGGSGAVAILDGRPGRLVSRIYQRYLTLSGGGRYLRGLTPDTGSSLLAGLAKGESGPVGLDLERTEVLLSFGAPVLDGWLPPGRSGKLRVGVPGRAESKSLELIQAETRCSRSALRANNWLRINPGTETALALGLARVIVDERLYNESFLRAHVPSFFVEEDSGYRRLINTHTITETADLTGLTPDQIRQTARQFANSPRSVAVPGVEAGASALTEEAEAIWGLNLLVGSIGRPGGYSLRNELPVSDLPVDEAESEKVVTDTEGSDNVITDLTSVPDHSIGLLIIDPAGTGCSIPKALLDRKLTGRAARIVSLSSYLTRITRNADLVIPAPAMLESLEEVPGPESAAQTSFSIADAFINAPPETVVPAELMLALGQAAGIEDLLGEGIDDYAGLLQNAVGDLFDTSRGRVFDIENNRFVPMTEVGSPSRLWNLLIAGGCWIDDEATWFPGEFDLPGFNKADEERIAAAGSGRIKKDVVGENGAAYPLVMMPYGARNERTDGVLPPELAKIYRESDLKTGSNTAIINPDTGATNRLRHGEEAMIETSRGSRTVKIIYEPAVMPGVVHVAVGPPASSYGDLKPVPDECLLDICDISENGDWKFSRARVREV